jgi:hypothetical protein
LLDFRPPAVARASFDPKPPLDASTETALAVFLNTLAIAALTGQARSAKQMDQTELHDQLPLSARRWLNRLGSAEVSLDQVPFEALTRRPAAVSTGRRAGVLAGYWLVPLVMATYLMTLLYAEKQFLREHPEVGELCGYVNFYHSLTETDAWQATVRRDVELVVADRFRDLIADDAVWSHSSMAGFLDSDDRQLLRTFVTAHPNPSRQGNRPLGCAYCVAGRSSGPWWRWCWACCWRRCITDVHDCSAPF